MNVYGALKKEKMSIWKSLFNKPNKPEKVNQSDKPIPENFRDLTKMAIELVGKDSKEMENEELFDYLISKGIPEFEAGELIVFLPIAFCRKMLPEIDWLPDYFDFYSEKKKIKREYKGNQRYLIIEDETESYWNKNPSNDYVLNIAGRSSEFHAINQLLNDGGELKDVKLTESYIVR